MNIFFQNIDGNVQKINFIWLKKAVKKIKRWKPAEFFKEPAQWL